MTFYAVWVKVEDCQDCNINASKIKQGVNFAMGGSGIFRAFGFITIVPQPVEHGLYIFPFICSLFLTSKLCGINLSSSAMHAAMRRKGSRLIFFLIDILFEEFTNFIMHFFGIFLQNK